MDKQNISPEDFSPHLFWDVDVETLDLTKDKTWLVKRVLDYGLMKDWRLLYELIGFEEISLYATKSRDLSEKSMYFISNVANIPINKFKCYTWKQSNPQHWAL
ncbi:hypothetical protein L21SP5_01946 [Salinivirga cyanobacteriivorans]|uniref:DUF6922 domain-containing protein n=1 Tax=Salinivirga cyanobacteriivorans TaxID=1307839 RepID=A0A0S2HZY1_9BACT|nr:hypothetical protein L21SP5_01946 [Salinivirga cyanobacteriivorans]